MLRDFGAITVARANSPCFLAYGNENGGAIPAAAGALFIHEGIAPFSGASTLPEVRPSVTLNAMVPRCVHPH
jgi:hypothetical protein